MSLNLNFDTVWGTLDADGNGTIDESEFKNFMKNLYQKQNMEVSENALNDGWKIISKKSVNGKLSKETVKKYCNLLFTI